MRIYTISLDVRPSSMRKKDCHFAVRARKEFVCMTPLRTPSSSIAFLVHRPHRLWRHHRISDKAARARRATLPVSCVRC